MIQAFALVRGNTEPFPCWFYLKLNKPCHHPLVSAPCQGMIQSQFSWQQHFVHSFIDVPIHSNSILLTLVPLVLALSTYSALRLRHPCLAPIPRECETSWVPLWHLPFSAAVQSWKCSLALPSPRNLLSLFVFKVKTLASYTPPLAHFSHKLETLINSFCSWVCIWVSSILWASSRVSAAPGVRKFFL